MSTHEKPNPALGLAFYGILSGIALTLIPEELFCRPPKGLAKGIAEGPAAIAEVFLKLCNSKLEIALFLGGTGLMALALYAFKRRNQN